MRTGLIYFFGGAVIGIILFWVIATLAKYIGGGMTCIIFVVACMIGFIACIKEEILHGNRGKKESERKAGQTKH